jgi:hypothetical protein
MSPIAATTVSAVTASMPGMGHQAAYWLAIERQRDERLVDASQLHTQRLELAQCGEDDVLLVKGELRQCSLNQPLPTRFAK